MDTKFFRGLAGKTKAQLEAIALDLGLDEKDIYAYEGGLLPLNALWWNIARKREQRAKEAA